MKKILFVSIFLFIFSCVKVGQVKPSRKEISFTYNSAMEAYTRQDYEEASDLFLYIVKNAEDKKIKAKSLFYLGEINKFLSKFGPSLFYYSVSSYYGINTEENIKELAPKADAKSLEKSIFYAPENLKSYLLYTLARKYQSQGREKESSEVFSKIIQKYPESIYARESKYVATTEGKFKVGVLLPFSGSYIGIGESVRRGIEIGSREKFIPIYADTKGKPLKSYKEALNLVKKEKVSGIIGPLLSLNSFGVSCLCDYLSMPLIPPTATKELIDSVGEKIYIINRSLSQQAKAMAFYATRVLGFKTFSILYPSTDYGETFEKNFVKTVKKQGGIIIASIAYREGDPDFKDELKTINEGSPEAVYIPAPTTDVPLISTQLKYYNIKSQVLGADGWKSEVIFRQIENSSLEGVVVSGEPYHPTKDFINRFKFVYQKNPDRYAGLGYDAANLMGRLLQNSEENLRESDLNLTAGSLNCENSYTKVPLYIINNGQFKPIKWE
ncbi:MAG: penicillin-binding protein activator [candidate division WOR-3 bacterium]|nr:penicillin-binding protein activator [candidate division WOR-3 bacterium]